MMPPWEDRDPLEGGLRYRKKGGELERAEAAKLPKRLSADERPLPGKNSSECFTPSSVLGDFVNSA